jgi:hypothetical protein
MTRFRPRFRRAPLIAVAMLAVLSTGSAQAATPSSGTISFKTPSLSWTSTTALNGTAATRRQITCNANPDACDNFTLTIDTTKHGTIDPNALVDIKANATGGAGEFSLVLYSPGCGTALTLASPCYSVFGHEAKLLNPQNGVWTVQLACTACVSLTYAASATVGDFAPSLPAAGKNFGFVSTQMPNFADGSLPDFGEPGISINKNGRVIVNTFGPIVWTSTNSGQTFSSALNLLNQDLLCPGGSGDADAVVANDNTFYAANLCFPTATGTSIDSFTNKQDGAQGGWLPPTVAGANADRHWYGVDPATPGVVYMSFHDFEGPNINVLKSTDFGQTWVCPTTGLVATTCPITATINGNNPNSGFVDTAEGNVTARPLVDPTNPSRVYVPYADNSAVASATAPPTNNDFDLTRIRVAVSNDGGKTWSADTTPTGAPALDANKAFPFDGVHDNVVAHIFPVGAIDTAGNLYILFSLRLGTGTQTHLYLIHSTDHGVTWSGPVQVDQGGISSNIFPWIVAGDAGRVGIVWYGSLAQDFNDTNAAWSEMFAQSLDALSAAPSFAQSNVSGTNPIHVGDVCQAGLNCTVTGGNRNLSDFQMIAVDPCGMAHPVWTDDHTGQGFTITARQTKGFSLYATKTC